MAGNAGTAGTFEVAERQRAAPPRRNAAASVAAAAPLAKAAAEDGRDAAAAVPAALARERRDFAGIREEGRRRTEPRAGRNRGSRPNKGALRAPTWAAAPAPKRPAAAGPALPPRYEATWTRRSPNHRTPAVVVVVAAVLPASLAVEPRRQRRRHRWKEGRTLGNSLR